MKDKEPLILKRSATGPDSMDRRRLDPLPVDEEKGETIVVPGQLPSPPPYEGDQVARKREAFRRRTISLVVRSEPGDDINRFDSLEQEMLDHESRRGNSEDVPDSFQKTMLDLKGLPRALREQLALFDDNDNGELDLGELAQAAVTIQKLRTETDAFSVNAFPKHLQEELQAFDVDGDGKFNASEIIRACRLYHDQKKQLRKMVRGLFILVVVIAVVLGINMSLSFAVTILSKEISVAGNGVMYTKDKDSVVSTGSVEDVVEVFADRDAFRKLTGRIPDEGFYKNHLEIKPEAVALIFADETIMNIPVNHMRATKDYVVFGNTILHQEVYMTNGSPPRLTHSSPEDDRLLQQMNATTEEGNRTCGIRNETEDALSDETVTVTPYHVCQEVPAATVVFIRVYIGKQFIRSYHNVSSSNMTLSEKIKLAINITHGGNLTMPERQSVVDAQESNSLVAKELELVAVEDMSQQIQKNPLANVDRGNHSSWTAHFNVSAEEGQGVTFEQLEAFCDILRPLNGECTRDCDEDFCDNDVTQWLSFDFLSFVLPGGNLTALLNHPKMAHGGADLNILLISKSFRVGAPSARVVPAEEADPNQTMRHGQVKELVMATRHGRRLMQRIRAMKAAAAEQHRRRKLLGDVSGIAFYDKMVEGTNEAGSDCYMKEKQYEGVIRITEDNEYCLPWTQEDIDEHAVDLDGLDLLGSVQCAKMNATGGEPPVCPSDFGYSREGRSLVPCAVKHCLEKVYTSFIEEDVIMDKMWGLQRIIANYSDDPTYEGSMSTDELQLDGEGVECYVVDTGVNLDHNEFVSTQGSRFGRLEYDAFKGTRYQKDENGHGTHVAGIIAGKTTGIAPRCRIHAVKVLNGQNTNGHGQFGDSIFHGLAVLAKDFRERKKANPNAKGVVNLSLAATSTSATWTSAVRMLHEEGLVVVAAAGNKDEDACSYSPAAEDYAITVGATNIDDTKAIFSNWGSCVQIYAPGSGIKSASSKDNESLIFMSGTSMAAPFVTGAVALYLKAHQSIDVSPDAAARFIYDTAMVGKVHGVDQKRTVYEKYGVTEEKWDFSVRLLNRLDFSASDDAENIAISKDNRLLHVDGQILKDQAALHTCSESGLDDGADQWGPWDLTEHDCPPPGPICGTEKDAPVVVARRRCIATNCICETEFDTKDISCSIDNSYEFVPQCGAPAAALESLEDITWLQGKRLRFKPQDSSGNYYDMCESETWTVPLEFSAMQGQSMLRKLKGGLAGQVIVSLQHGFWFKAHPQGTMQPYYKITVFASGHIKFGAWKTQYTIFNPQDYTMDTHLSKGLGISGLFTGLDFSNCKFPKCGDLQIRKGVSPDGTPVAIISYYNVPSKHAPLDDPMYKSSFKIILYLGEKRKGEFELVYDSISKTAQNGAVYGVSLGEKSRPALINPNRAISCYE